jgi:general secretion pathway protein G
MREDLMLSTFTTDRVPHRRPSQNVRAWIALALRLRARARQAPARGVTLVEVLIVVAIIAMVAGGVAFYALPRFKESQIKSADTGARVIRQAVQSWQMSTGESSCPSVSQLVQEKQLDPGANTNDPWGQAYVLNCTEDEVIVTSTGPDKKKGSKDDIVVPKGAQASE